MMNYFYYSLRTSRIYLQVERRLEMSQRDNNEQWSGERDAKYIHRKNRGLIVDKVWRCMIFQCILTCSIYLCSGGRDIICSNKFNVEQVRR